MHTHSTIIQLFGIKSFFFYNLVNNDDTNKLLFELMKQLKIELLSHHTVNELIILLVLDL